jgi:aminopeptidase N
MEYTELGALLEAHKSTLKELAQSLVSNDGAKTAGLAATLVMALATGHPEVAILAPLAQRAIAKAFGNSANATLRKELAAIQAEEAKRAFAAQIGEPIEVLIGQALVQLIRAQHNIKDEVLNVLGGVREDLSGFRKQFAQESAGSAATIDAQLVSAGATGVRVRESSTAHVFIARQEVSGGGSIGIDI